MKDIACTAKWIVALLGFMVWLLWFPCVVYVHYLNIQARKSVVEHTWITRKENIRLMRYHGTHGLKITGDRVYIRRDGKWLPVLKRSQA